MYCMALTQQERVPRFSIVGDTVAPPDPRYVLHPVEHARYQQMSAARRSDFLKGRYAIKSLLGAYTTPRMQDLLIAATCSGKPYAPSAPGLFCSISHTDGYAAAAVSARLPVGIDIERIKPRHPALLRDISDQTEVGYFVKIYAAEVVPTVLWAIKEAVAKADEHIYPWRAYTVWGGSPVRVTRGCCTWEVSVTMLPMHVCAVAVKM